MSPILDGSSNTSTFPLAVDSRVIASAFDACNVISVHKSVAALVAVSIAVPAPLSASHEPWPQETNFFLTLLLEEALA